MWSTCQSTYSAIQPDSPKIRLHYALEFDLPRPSSSNNTSFGSVPLLFARKWSEIRNATSGRREMQISR